jgi:hypothetical protein
MDIRANLLISIGIAHRHAGIAIGYLPDRWIFLPLNILAARIIAASRSQLPELRCAGCGNERGDNACTYPEKKNNHPQ